MDGHPVDRHPVDRHPVDGHPVDRPAAGSRRWAATASRWRAARASLRRAAPALLAFGAARLCGALVVVLACLLLDQPPYARLLQQWDSLWYQSIATSGYGFIAHSATGAARYDVAFFPLYPLLIHALTLVTPLSAPLAGLVVSCAFALLAAWGVHAVAERLGGLATARSLVLLWALLPHSVLLTVPYTESLLTAFGAWSLHAVLSGRWVWAGALSLLAGLSRPNGVAVAAAVGLAGLCALWRLRGTRPYEAGHAGRILLGVLLAPLGWLGWVVYVGHREGDPLRGYFAVQREWGSVFDFGAGLLRFLNELTQGSHEAVYSVAALTVLAALVLYALLLCERRRLPLAVLVYTGMLLLIAVGGAGYYSCKPRMLLPAFPLLLPPALLLARLLRTRRREALVLVASLAGFSAVYGAYLITRGGRAL